MHSNAQLQQTMDSMTDSKLQISGSFVPLHLSRTRIDKMLVLASRGQVAGKGLLWELNPGPLAPEARIIPLDQAAGAVYAILSSL